MSVDKLLNSLWILMILSMQDLRSLILALNPSI
jgi:hypothetical protein